MDTRSRLAQEVQDRQGLRVEQEERAVLLEQQSLLISRVAVEVVQPRAQRVVERVVVLHQQRQRLACSVHQKLRRILVVLLVVAEEAGLVVLERMAARLVDILAVRAESQRADSRVVAAEHLRSMVLAQQVEPEGRQDSPQVRLCTVLGVAAVADAPRRRLRLVAQERQGTF
jgi:hypothetical protein